MFANWESLCKEAALKQCVLRVSIEKRSRLFTEGYMSYWIKRNIYLKNNICTFLFHSTFNCLKKYKLPIKGLTETGCFLNDYCTFEIIPWMLRLIKNAFLYYKTGILFIFPITLKIKFCSWFEWSTSHL